MRYVMMGRLKNSDILAGSLLEINHLPHNMVEGVTHIEEGVRTGRDSNGNHYSVHYRRVFHEECCVWAELSWSDDDDMQFVMVLFKEGQESHMTKVLTYLEQVCFSAIRFGEEYMDPLPTYSPRELQSEIERLNTGLVPLVARSARQWWQRYCAPRPPIYLTKYGSM